MAFALLLLGLLPMMFIADILPGGDEEPDARPEDDPGASMDAQRSGGDTLLASLFEDATDGQPDSGEGLAGLGGSAPLQPVTGDEIPTSGADIDPDELLTPISGPDDPFDPPDTGTGPVLEPILGDEAPISGDPVEAEHVLAPVTGSETVTEADPFDLGTVLSAITDPGDDAPADGDADLLQSLLATETDFNAGAGWLGDHGPDTHNVWLDHAETYAAPDDGHSDTSGSGVSEHEGTPVVWGDGKVAVVSGGDGANAIALGDDPAYAFGGAGDDSLAAGDGAAALFGGAGNDVLSGSTSGIWADGGADNDTIAGGEGDDVLYGGAHMAGATGQDDDVISGGGGDDTIAGGYGADVLSGGEGDDVIDNLGRVEETHSTTTADDFSFHTDGAADVLEGGAGNDTLIMDRLDTATGGAGFDTFWVFHDSSVGEGAAEVTDFTVGQDVLRVTLNPDLDHGDMTLSVSPSENGQDAIVRVNGEVVAMLRGAVDASAADVLVEIGERYER